MTTLVLFLFQQRAAISRSRGTRSLGTEHGKEVAIMKRTLSQRLIRLAVVAVPMTAFALGFAGGKIP